MVQTHKPFPVRCFLSETTLTVQIACVCRSDTRTVSCLLFPGTKWIITKVIADINSLIVERGSRTRVKYFEIVLQESLQATMVCHEELMLLFEENDP